MMLPRVDHWERLLAAAIDTARAKPFVWGVHDCPTFAFETRMILTDGDDVAAFWRGRYTTALGGERVMRRLGWASLETWGERFWENRGRLSFLPNAVTSLWPILASASASALGPAPSGWHLRAL